MEKLLPWYKYYYRSCIGHSHLILKKQPSKKHGGVGEGPGAPFQEKNTRLTATTKTTKIHSLALKPETYASIMPFQKNYKFRAVLNGRGGDNFRVFLDRITYAGSFININ